MNKIVKSYQDIEKNYSFDELSLYLGRDYAANDKIQIHQPTIGEIADYGEARYYLMVQTLCAIPSDMKQVLDDIGIDYAKLPDFDLFIMLTRSLKPSETGILFGELDLSRMVPMKNQENGQIFLWDEEKDIRIDEKMYFQIVTFLRMLHGLVPKPEFPATKTVRKILIEEDRNKRKKKSDEPYHSQLKELISGVMRFPGFKYKTCELSQCGIYEFMDSVKGASIYVQSTALLRGMYSGMIDGSKINKKDLDWMRSI